MNKDILLLLSFVFIGLVTIHTAIKALISLFKMVKSKGSDDFLKNKREFNAQFIFCLFFLLIWMTVIMVIYGNN